MYLKKIKLENYRNYDNIEINLSKNINIFFGENAIGKTNILEAIYFSCITKSYRVKKNIDCIQIDKEYMKIDSEFVINKRNYKVNIYLDKENNKKLKLNNILVNKYSSYIGKFPVVMFSPESMDIIKGSPKERRNFLDILICQMSKSYFIALQEYRKTLKIKNLLLKNKNIDLNYLDIIDEKLAENIYIIVKKRYETIEKINEYVNKIQKIISNEKENISIKYITELNKESIVKNYEILKNARKLDILREKSNKSIGHDDLNFNINNKEINVFGSQGQIRTAVLSLKLAEVEIIKEIKEKKPVILLDDVLSELDIERINNLLENIGNYQVIITTTNIEEIINKNKLKKLQLMKVKSGKVEKIKD